MIVLASASPRRAEILRLAGISFVVRPTHIEELRRESESAEAYVRRLAAEKASAAWRTGLEGTYSPPGKEPFVLGADTTVQIDGHILEKPADPEEAARMVRLLAGRTHEVLTGVCVRRGETSMVDCETTRVRFLPLTEDEIIAYAHSGEPMDKAGGYAIQGLASRYVDRVEGCYLNVVGLPVSLVWRMLKQFA